MTISKIILISFIIALVADYVFIVVSGLNYSEKIYGDSSEGSFACQNFHGDVFYCSGLEYFTSYALSALLFALLFSGSLFLLIPFGIILSGMLLWKKFRIIRMQSV